MPTPIDLNTWPRRHAHRHFRHYPLPWFGACVRVDVTALKPALATLGLGSFSLACHHAALREANRVRAWRLRLDGEGVVELEAVHASTTVAREDGSFGFALLPWEARFDDFVARGAAAMQAAKSADLDNPLAPTDDERSQVHFTTLPWLHFSSFSFARGTAGTDIPKIAFGRVQEEAGRQWMPVALELHHALADGADLGEFVAGFEAAMRDPLDWLRGGGVG